MKNRVYMHKRHEVSRIVQKGKIMGAYITRLGNKFQNSKEANKEFISRMANLFWLSGMMKCQYSQLYGKTIITLEKEEADFEKEALYFCYNYFENDIQEGAYFSIKTSRVYSDKVGCSYFAYSVYAACILETIQSEIPLIPLHEGNLLDREKYLGWINYIFNESYTEKNIPQMLDYYLYIHKNCSEYEKDEEFLNDVKKLIRYSPYFDAFVVYGVINGIIDMKQYLANSAYNWSCRRNNTEMRFTLNLCEKIENALYEFKNNTNIPEAKQAEYIIEYIIKRFIDTKNIDELLEMLYASVIIQKSSMALIIKYISEIYDIDFWILWNKFEKCYYCNCHFNKIDNVSTEDFLGINGDERIVYWSKEGDVKFSEELKKWFSELKNQFNEFLNKPNKKFISIKELFEMLDEVDRKFEHIYAFTECLYDTIESISDMRYQAIWSIFKDIMQTPFEDDEIKNEIKVKLRRFLAICYNKELRKEIFEF